MEWGIAIGLGLWFSFIGLIATLRIDKDFKKEEGKE